MKRVLVNRLPNGAGEALEIEAQEAHHLVHVLRAQAGDTVEAICPEQRKAQVLVLQMRGKKAYLVRDSAQFRERVAEASPQRKKFILAVAVLKSEAMEWVIEKAVELGAQAVQPLETRHQVVKTRGKGSEVFRERWQKIADQALKQCGRIDRLQVFEPVALGVFLEQSRESVNTVYFADEMRAESGALWDGTLGADGVSAGLVGPEGGWSAEERALILSDARVKPVALAPWVLRAETATLCFLSRIF